MQDTKLIIKLKGNPRIITLGAPPTHTPPKKTQKNKSKHRPHPTPSPQAVRASKTFHSVALRYSRVS